ncbi:GAF domain-containing protein [Algiphilus sp. W345]|uniref:GAF domain-containing protein n=1 Tax=Banduia mediterranea TaxID=3075609 RepID=A0ABU2WJF8_9GAMM|nr:GAF domain-containing protein [Algiphilus sp. W345]MDT0498004.1 GAF domain-containing protein [Algiphilus sp. W345]
MFETSKPARGADKAESYELLAQQAQALFDGEQNLIANAANLSALLFNGMTDLNWAGFYFFDGRELVLGPFQGKPACIRIQLGRGVCGTAASHCQTQVVADVHAFPGHIACDAASNSEIVIPLLDGERLLGVLDLDSPLAHRFDEADRLGLERIAAIWIAACAKPA